jgi:hypothetical protein
MIEMLIALLIQSGIFVGILTVLAYVISIVFPPVRAVVNAKVIMGLFVILVVYNYLISSGVLPL